MKMTWLFFSFAAIVLFGQDFGPDIAFPGQQMMSGENELRSLGVLVRFKVMVSSTGKVPVRPWSSTSGLLSTKGSTVKRIQFDPHDGVWLGYDIAVAGDAANGFVLTFGPPSASTRKGPDGETLDVRPPQRYPAAQRIHDGDVVAVDLRVSADGAQKLTDYIQIISQGRAPEPAEPNKRPRQLAFDQY